MLPVFCYCDEITRIKRLTPITSTIQHSLSSSSRLNLGTKLGCLTNTEVVLEIGTTYIEIVGYRIHGLVGKFNKGQECTDKMAKQFIIELYKKVKMI